MEDNILKKIGDGIVDYAPTIAGFLNATGIGAPAGLALTAISSLGKAFGLGSNPTPDALHAAIAADPQAASKAMIAEQDFILQQRGQDIEELKINLADVQSARDREVKITQVTGKKDLSMEVLGWIIVVGFFTILVVRMFVTIPPTQVENVGMMIGALIGAFTTVVGYKYGSSKGSADKSAAMAAMLDKPDKV
jgi:hypothetical protein